MKKIYVLLLTLSLQACVDAVRHSRELHSAEDRRMTLGVVQREIRNGMSQGDVAAALGSPNIVSKDIGGVETWIYDKIATEASYSRSQGGAGLLGGIAAQAGSVLLLGIPSGHYSKQAGASALTQRTLTVVIKFDRSNLVESARYHSSSF